MRKVFPSGGAEDTVLLYSALREYSSEDRRLEQLVCPHSGSQRSGSESMSDQTVSLYSDFLLWRSDGTPERILSPSSDLLARNVGYKSGLAVFPFAGIISRSIKSALALSKHLLSSRVSWAPSRTLRFDAIR